MNRSFRTLLVFALAVGLLLGLGSFSKTEAVKIYGYSDNMPLSNCGGTCYYNALYEFYGNEQVIAGNPYDDVIIRFVPGRTYPGGNAPENTPASGKISLQLKNGKFLAPPSGQVYCLYSGSTIYALQNSLNYTYSFPTDTVYFYFIQTYTPTSPATYLTLGFCDPNDLEETPTAMTQIQINPNLGTSCTKTADVKISWNANDQDCCEATLIRIASNIISAKMNFTAELDTDNDFKSFVGTTSGKPNTILDTCCNAGSANCPISKCKSATSCYTVPTPTQETSCPSQYVLGDKTLLKENAIVRLSFKINSINEEAGIDKIVYKDTTTTCTKLDNYTWNCNFDCINCPTCEDGEKFLNVYLKGTVPNNPTIWSISDVSLNNVCQIDPRIKDLCCSLNEGEVGVWYGGLEALVPFVRHDPSNGFYTTIKLISRYSSDVKVFVAPFTSSSKAMVLPITEIGTIPASGNRTLTITGADLASAFGSAAFQSGAPLKIHVRVKGANSYIGKDPYVEGIVVSDSPGGTRSIPLKFKTNLHGAFAE